MITVENPTRADYEELMASSDVNPAFTFENYLQLCRERRALTAEATRRGWSDGYEEPPDLDEPETQEIICQLAEWAVANVLAGRREAA